MSESLPTVRGKLKMEVGTVAVLSVGAVTAPPYVPFPFPESICQLVRGSAGHTYCSFILISWVATGFSVAADPPPPHTHTHKPTLSPAYLKKKITGDFFLIFSVHIERGRRSTQQNVQYIIANKLMFAVMHTLHSRLIPGHMGLDGLGRGVVVFVFCTR